MSSPAVPMEATQSLCKSCGLCCGGALFFRAEVKPGELDALVSLGLYVSRDETGPHFTLPCTMLDGTCCTIHKTKPEVCRNYRCRVLERLESGELTAGRAQAIVNQAKLLEKTANELLANAGGPNMSIWKRLEEFAKQEGLTLEEEEFSRRHWLLGMHLMMFRDLINEEFRAKKQPAGKVLDLDESLWDGQ